MVMRLTMTDCSPREESLPEGNDPVTGLPGPRLLRLAENSWPTGVRRVHPDYPRRPRWIVKLKTAENMTRTAQLACLICSTNFILRGRSTGISTPIA